MNLNLVSAVALATLFLLLNLQIPVLPLLVLGGALWLGWQWLVEDNLLVDPPRA